MHSPKLEAGSREHLELHRTQDKGLEICGRSQEGQSFTTGPQDLLFFLEDFRKSAEFLVWELLLCAEGEVLQVFT